ncbi:probable calcium-binding protein cml14 [Phtheirospermum japonicum]|uniref:Probable calcium-binding protein cml14 n=1 Tax=Phtheirospermum japonicum TaxID=374723 RepID=A0A830C436_9LAMI|nr:probable calcium-binding protein cml14 [Phtheirospermum japonicum]
MSKHLKPEPFDRQLRDAFKLLDKEGTGYVIVSNLRHILTSIGEKLELAEFDEWICEVDVGSEARSGTRISSRECLLSEQVIGKCWLCCVFFCLE